jgi:hypothetical protein
MPPHHTVSCQDYFFHKEGTANGGNRYATVLTYLADVEEGGETVSLWGGALRLAQPERLGSVVKPSPGSVSTSQPCLPPPPGVPLHPRTGR